MDAFERVIEEIDNEISIQKGDRESYSRDFDLIRNHILDIMQLHDPIFRQIYRGPSLFGSRLDNIKINKPDEFDVHFVLEFPCQQHLIIKRDPSHPGMVNLKMDNILAERKRNPSVATLCPTISSLIIYENFLDCNKLQTWIETILTKALANRSNNLISHDGKYMYTLSYKKHATAHFIKACSSGRNICIDLVPAFKFVKNKKFNKLKFKKGTNDGPWFVVPKPMKDSNLTFGISVPHMEKELIRNKHNLKRALRLMKSLRDNMKERAWKLKSYIIKTIFLYENNCREDSFWQKPVGFLLMHMINVLCTNLKARNIAFYWDRDLNLLSSMKAHEIDEICEMFLEVQIKLERFSSHDKVNYRDVRALFGESSDTVNEEKA